MFNKLFIVFPMLLFFTGILLSADNGLDFNGSSQYVDCGNLSVTGAGTRTLEAWVNCRTFNDRGVLKMGTPGVSMGEFTLRTHGSVDDVWVAQFWGSDIDFLAPGSKNNWTHLALTYDGTNVKIYINGNFHSSHARVINTTSDNFEIGKWGGSVFDGKIDEVRVWNIERSEAEIQSTMIVGLKGNESGLIAYYPMNEGTGTIIGDYSPNSYTGNLVGSPAWVNGYTEIYQPAGSGTDIDPFQISNLTDLYWLTQHSEHFDKYYSQTADIDASATNTWFNGDGFGCIGNSDFSFSGTYDGAGHVVSNVYINRPADDHVGLFGSASEAVIQNIGVTGVNITGQYWVGGLLGFGWITNISNSFSTGSVTGSLDIVGGLIGGLWNDGVITDCYTTATASGQNKIGGLTGLVNNNCGFVNCYSTGLVSAAGPNVGGFLGIDELTGYAADCFWDTQTSGQASSALGTGKNTSEMKTLATYTGSGWDFQQETVNGSNDTWGLNTVDNSGYPFLSWQGYIHYYSPSVTTQSAADVFPTHVTGSGSISGPGSPLPSQHGVCWNTTGNPTLADSFTEEGAVSAEGVFTSVVTGLEKETTYYMRAYAVNSLGIVYGNEINFTTPYLKGSGIQADPYLISCLEDLKTLSEDTSIWDKQFLQVADIDAAETSVWGSGYNVGLPLIGTSALGFTGVYDGGNYTITNLYCKHNDPGYGVQGIRVGMFGNVYSASLSNINLTGLYVNGNEIVGGLAGQVHTSTVTNCHVSGTVLNSENSADTAGGLIGYADSSTITDCSADCGVTTVYSMGGGLIAKMLHTDVSGCSSNGSVTGTSFSGDVLGGLIGQAEGTSSVINCFSTSSVSGRFDRAAGLIGQNYGTVRSCYATGNVDGQTGIGAGGLIGYDLGSTWNCYATGNVNSSQQCGGLIGAKGSSSELYYSYSTGTVANVGMSGGLIGLWSGTVYDSFWDTETSGRSDSNGGTGLTTAEMKEYSSFVTRWWDFKGESTNGTDDHWTIISTDNNGYPALSWQGYGQTAAVSTQPVNRLYVSTAKGNGTIDNFGDPSVIQHGICWNDSGNPTLIDNKTELGATAAQGPFTSEITGLSFETLYYVRSYAITPSDTLYGEEVNFTSAGYEAGSGAGNCVYFDGADDYINTGLNAQPSAITETTWECWFKPTRTNFPTDFQAILSTDDGGWDRGIWIVPNTDQLVIGYGLDGWYTGLSVTQDQWHHIAIVYKTDNVLFYLNGQEYSLGAAPAGQNTTCDLAIGASANGVYQWFQGEIDEVRIWNTVRTKDQIQASYGPLSGSDSALAAYWKLDEDSGVLAYDATWKGNTGTLYNGPARITPSSAPVADPVYQTSLTTIDFGNTTQGVSSDTTLTISNTGGGILHISNASLDNMAYSIVPDAVDIF